MPGQPKTRAVKAELQARGAADGQSAVDYVCGWVGSGKTIQSLADDIGAAIGQSCSRYLISQVARNLTPDAGNRIDAARREGAHALADEVLHIADATGHTTAAEVAHGRLRMDARTWLAARMSPGEFSNHANLAVSLSLGDLHLEAIRPVSRPGSEPRVETEASVARLPAGNLVEMPIDDVEIEVRDDNSNAA
jgi:hypothetical protein